MSHITAAHVNAFLHSEAMKQQKARMDDGKPADICPIHTPLFVAALLHPQQANTDYCIEPSEPVPVCVIRGRGQHPAQYKIPIAQNAIKVLERAGWVKEVYAWNFRHLVLSELGAKKVIEKVFS